MAQGGFRHLGFPVWPTDTLTRQLQESPAEVVIVDVPRKAASALSATLN